MHTMAEHPRYVVFLSVDSPELVKRYHRTILEQLQPAYQSNPYKDSGFDLYLPKHAPDLIPGRGTTLVDLKVKVAAYKMPRRGGSGATAVGTPQALHIYARSSIGKTPLRLANGVGVIDAGYRGNLKACFDNISDQAYKLEPGSRLVQICLPNLHPFQVVLSEGLDETARSSGGFGSTGI